MLTAHDNPRFSAEVLTAEYANINTIVSNEPTIIVPLLPNLFKSQINPAITGPKIAQTLTIRLFL